MKKFLITFTETLTKEVEISANTEEEAMGCAYDMYVREDVVLDYNDFTTYNIELKEIKKSVDNE